jgi:hypothetical protein
MKKLKLLFMQKQRNKGQSFMELTIFMLVLVLLVMGMAEAGNLLNQYVNLVDGAREGARFGSNNDPFYDPVTKTDDYTVVQSTFFDGIITIVDGTGTGTLGSIAPLKLERANGDDIVISFLSIRNGGYVTYPSWSHSKYGNHTSKILADPGFISSSISDNLAPNTGILIVEIFYRYHQLLNFYPAPIDVNAYAIMPLSAAEPTPVIP